MASEDSELERTEPASQKRLDDARAEGNIARSPELSAFAVTISAMAVIWFMGGGLMDGMKRLMVNGLTLDASIVREPSAMTERLYGFASEALMIGAPVMIVTVLAALIAPMAIGGWSFVP